MFHIVADSGCDIFKLDGVSFATVPLTISTDKQTFVDDETLDTADMIKKLLAHKGRSFTACPSTEDWMKAFLTEDGSVPDEIYVVTLTSGLSGTFNSANVAKGLFLEQHPDTKIMLIDSLSVGPEMLLILEKLVEFKKAGMSFEEIERSINAYADSARLFFAFKSLHNLAENGRVSKLVASAAGVLGISVLGTADKEGHIKSLGKARGDARVISSFINSIREAGFTGGKVRISHTENEQLAEKLRAAVLEVNPDVDIKYYPVRGLCSYYCERGGICIAVET